MRERERRRNVMGEMGIYILYIYLFLFIFFITFSALSLAAWWHAGLRERGIW